MVLKIYEIQMIPVTAAVIEALTKTRVYVLSIFLEFMLNVDGKCVSVSGKSFRIYSALRLELMSFFMNTHVAVVADIIRNNSQGENGSGAQLRRNQPVDPLKLAEKLCNQLTSAPIKEIVHDEDDIGVVRIAQFMLDGEQRGALEAFLATEMTLPDGMHSAQRTLWLQTIQAHKESCQSGSSNGLTLECLMEVFHKVLQEALKPQWLMFAADCMEHFVARGGHFVEKSGDVWKSATLLSDFVALRMKYLRQLLKQILTSSGVPLDVTPLVKAGLKLFVADDVSQPLLQLLSVLDLLTANDEAHLWSKLWSTAFCNSVSPAELVKQLTATLKLDAEALQKKWKIASSTEAEADGQAEQKNKENVDPEADDEAPKPTDGADEESPHCFSLGNWACSFYNTLKGKITFEHSKPVYKYINRPVSQ